jgi:Homeodomain-like domain
MAVLSMSDGELRRLEVLRDVDRGGLPVRAAAQLLGRSERQVWRLLKEFRAAGAAGLVSKKRGQPSNRRTAAAVRAAALWIVRQNYADFGPTLAAEKLACKAAIGKRVTVVDYPDGRLSIRYRGVELAYRTFDKIRQVSQAAIVENKQLGAALAFIHDQQLRREPEHRSDRAPRRRDQHTPRLFKVG